MISQVINAVTAIFIVRYLGLSLYSDYSAAMLFMALFSVMGRLGFNRVFLRDCSKDIVQTPGYFSGALLLNFGLAFLGFLVAILIAYFRYDHQVFVLTLLLGSSLMLLSLTQTSTRVFQVHQKLHFGAVVDIITAIIYATSFFIAIYLKTSVFVLAGLHLFSNLFKLLFGFIFSMRLSRPRYDISILKKLISTGRHFCVIDVMMIIYGSASGFILALFNMNNQPGIFNAAFRIFAMLQMMGQVIDSAISPALYNISLDQDRLLSGFRRVIRYFSGLGIFAGIICIGRAEWLLITIFKAEFSQSTYVMMILGIGIGLRFLFIPANHIIYAVNKERFMMISMTVLALLSVILCLGLIPFWGAVGAALVFVIIELIMVVICFVKIEQAFARAGTVKLLVYPILASVLTIGFLMVTRQYSISGLLISPLLYFGFLLMVGYYRLPEILQLGRQFLNFN